MDVMSLRRQLIAGIDHENLLSFDQNSRYVYGTPNGDVTFLQKKVSVKNGSATFGYKKTLEQGDYRFSVVMNYLVQSATVRFRIYIYSDGNWYRIINQTFQDVSEKSYSQDFLWGSTYAGMECALCIYVSGYETEAPGGEIIVSDWKLQKIQSV